MTATNQSRSCGRWAEVEDLVASLARRWNSGKYLRAYALGEPWEPIELSVKGPSSDDLLHRFDEVRRWATAFERAASGLFEVEHKTIGGRKIGANRVPCKARIPTLDALCKALGTSKDREALDRLLERTKEILPGLFGWACEHPLTLVAEQDNWDQVLATMGWIISNDTRQAYLRQIDADGVDTKFVERKKKLLAELLPLVLAPERLATNFQGSHFAEKFGFLAKPTYTRLRFLDPGHSPFPAGISELTTRTDELARLEITASTVFIVENEVTYLAFPPVERSLVIFGSGFAAAGLAGLSWLADKEVAYWGDIDTHGFAILNCLRDQFPNVVSFLMDRETLQFHQRHWGSEDRPTRQSLANLTENEQSLYSDLANDVYGVGVRLEQERIRFSKLREALLPWTG